MKLISHAVSILLFLIPLLLFSVRGYAQADLKSGYIITLRGDTIQGYIQDAIDQVLSLGIHFSETGESSDSKYYDPSELTGFGFSTGRVFSSFPKHMHYTEALDSSCVFAKKVLEGRIDIYDWRHSRTRSSLYLRNRETGKVVQLVRPKTKTVTENEGSQWVLEPRDHNGLINLVANDPVVMSGLKSGTRYSEKIITRKISTYNQIYQKKYPVSKYTEPRRYQYDICGGIIFAEETSGIHFGVRQARFFYEKSTGFAYVRSINMHYARLVDRNFQTHYYAFSLLPLGSMYLAKGRVFSPYCVFSGGAALFYSYTDYNGELFSKEKPLVVPMIDIIGGTYIHMGSQDFLIEFGIKYPGWNFNIGYSF